MSIDRGKYQKNSCGNQQNGGKCQRFPLLFSAVRSICLIIHCWPPSCHSAVLSLTPEYSVAAVPVFFLPRRRQHVPVMSAAPSRSLSEPQSCIASWRKTFFISDNLILPVNAGTVKYLYRIPVHTYRVCGNLPSGSVPSASHESSIRRSAGALPRLRHSIRQHGSPGSPAYRSRSIRPD